MRRHLDVTRLCVALHLACAIICLITSLSDRGLFISVAVSRAIFPMAQFLVTPVAGVGLLCPLVVVITSVFTMSTFREKLYGLIAEVSLTLCLLAVLLPAVM